MTEKTTVLGEWPRNARDVVRVSLSQFRGYTSLDIREWFPQDGQFKPGRKGVSIPLAALPKLIAALDEAQRLAGPTSPQQRKEAGR